MRLGGSGVGELWQYSPRDGGIELTHVKSNHTLSPVKAASALNAAIPAMLEAGIELKNLVRGGSWHDPVH